MTAFAQAVNTDINGVRTSAKYGDRGDGTSEWVESAVIADGGSPALGATTDAAATDHLFDSSLVAIQKALLRLHRVADEGICKEEDTEAFSGDVGIMALAVRRDAAASFASADNDYSTLNTDALGALRVTHNSPTNATTTAYSTSLVVKASAGICYGLQGYNSLATEQFIQVHDAASLPADTAVPKVMFAVPAESSFSIDFGAHGRAFATGIVVCNSTTGATKTIGAADCWIDAQYL